MNKFFSTDNYTQNKTYNIVLMVLLFLTYMYSCYYGLTLTFALMPYMGFAITESYAATVFWFALIITAGIALLLFEFFLRLSYNYLRRVYAGRIFKENRPAGGSGAFMAKFPEYPINVYDYKFWARVFFIILNIVIGSFNFLPLYIPLLNSFYIVIKLIIKTIVLGLLVLFYLKKFCKPSNPATVMATFQLPLILVVIFVF